MMKMRMSMSSEIKHTDLVPQSSSTEMHPFKNLLKKQKNTPTQHAWSESFIHIVFLPRNELGINSTFLKTKNFK